MLHLQGSKNRQILLMLRGRELAWPTLQHRNETEEKPLEFALASFRAEAWFVTHIYISAPVSCFQLTASWGEFRSLCSNLIVSFVRDVAAEDEEEYSCQ